MKKRPILLWPVILFLIRLAAATISPLPGVARGEGGHAVRATAGQQRRYIETLPVYDARTLGYEPVQIQGDPDQTLPLTPGGGSDPGNPFAVIRKAGPDYRQTGATAGYAITVANYESVTRTYHLTDTVPPQLAYVPGSADGLDYDPATRELTWRGEIGPGNLDYVIEPAAAALPYLDLADFGAVNLCDDLVANGEACDEALITFNLGVNGYTYSLYGQVQSQITLSANGMALGIGMPGPDERQHNHNHWLPQPKPPNFLLAGLWRDVDMTHYGRWHAAVVTGLIQDHDVFYAQWHNAPHAADPNLTARHAIAIILNGGASAASAQPLAGNAFYIYDNVSDPAGTVARGYTIGVDGKLGLRGATHAFAPCCGDPWPPQGFPPAAGTTLRLRPLLFGAGNDFSRTFTYKARVMGQVPQTITNTAMATSSSADPDLALVWSTHYLYVRWQAYLPAIAGRVGP